MDEVIFTIDFTDLQKENLFMKYLKRYLKGWNLYELIKFNDGSNTGKYELTKIGNNFDDEIEMLVNYLEKRKINYQWE